MDVRTATEHALAAQGLSAVDLEANRAGRVSTAQLARLASVQTGGHAIVWMLAVGAAASVLGAGYHYLQHHAAPIFVLPVVAVAFCAFLYFVVYRRNRLPLPREIEGAKVLLVRARVGGAMVAANRGVYDVWLDGVRHSGCATSLTDDVRTKGRVVDAYVLRAHKLVLALVPAA